MRALIFLGGLLLPVAALAFPIEVQQQLNGTEIEVQTLDLGNNTASLSLHNFGEHNVICKARFSNGPETPRTRQAQVMAKGVAHLTVRFSTAVIKARIRIECHPV
ncbi:3-phosphoglycerate kinase [Denitrificimonas sp. JX-1]|uniref:3-phosphoglycerate kinase n=1 Tax=Denitrificimonas halotolerans TaxID=3098930 RepID=A0ABU5GPK4_9GAMM|nr:3-phosphoglycerate kinase [Denitrificimonas sp. JX-1]MDY7218934.1 3-phosphoglycerate kinase [Denitrificimonas sp. JX-1]